MIRKILPMALTILAFLGGAAGGELLKERGPAETAAAETGPGVEGGTMAQAAAAHPPGGKPGGVLPDLSGDAGPPRQHAAATGVEAPAGGDSPPGHERSGTAASETAWFKFPQQFFIPVLHDGQLDSTMVLSLSAEMPETAREAVHAHEIKLRDALLRQLLIHANTGGFDGNFTSEAHLRALRSELAKAARGVVAEIGDILIGDIARQEQ